MRVQIIGGFWKSRRLTIPTGPAIRPTSQLVRKALFDLLGPRVQGASVLDLFAGTGALGLEALSRGAAAVVFVDRAPACVAAIRRSLQILELPGGVTAEVLTEDAGAALRHLAQAGRRFDLILLDPPYEGRWGKKSLQGVGAHATLAPSGVVVVEHARRMAPGETVDGAPGAGRLHVTRRVHYGDTGLAFYSWMTEDQQ